MFSLVNKMNRVRVCGGLLGEYFHARSAMLHWKRFKILHSHKPMHYNGTEINTNIQYRYLHAHDKTMDVTQ